MSWSKDENLAKYGILMQNETKKLPLGKETKTFQVYKIPVELLKYNKRNGRIFMEMNRLLNEEQIDINSLEYDNVNEFNNEIEKLIWESSIEENKDTLNNIELYGQLESGVVLDDGTVIDGNRRFTCLRRLHSMHPENPDYKYFNATIIFTDDKAISQTDIRKYELQVQYGMDKKVNYKTINFNMSIYNDVKSEMLTPQEVATYANIKTSDVTKIMNTCPLVEEFLVYIKKEGQLSLAQDLDIYWPLETLASYLNGSEGKKLTKIEKQKKKRMFFDYIMFLPVNLPTQTLRDQVINKIFKDENAFEKLYAKYDETTGKKIDEILFNGPEKTNEEFVKMVKNIRDGEIGQEAKEDYEKISSSIGLQRAIDKPLKDCGDIKGIIQEMNLIPLLESNTEKSEEILMSIRSHILEIQSLLTGIVENINNKVG